MQRLGGGVWRMMVARTFGGCKYCKRNAKAPEDPGPSGKPWCGSLTKLSIDQPEGKVKLSKEIISDFSTH
jgi:hypothetical protein